MVVLMYRMRRGVRGRTIRIEEMKKMVRNEFWGVILPCNHFHNRYSDQSISTFTLYMIIVVLFDVFFSDDFNYQSLLLSFFSFHITLYPGGISIFVDHCSLEMQ